MQIELHVVWGTGEDPQDPFVRRLDLPFVPIIGMEFDLNILDAERSSEHSLPPIIVERVVMFLNVDDNEEHQTIDVYSRPIPQKDIEGVLHLLKSDPKWWQ